MRTRSGFCGPHSVQWTYFIKVTPGLRSHIPFEVKLGAGDERRFCYPLLVIIKFGPPWKVGRHTHRVQLKG